MRWKRAASCSGEFVDSMGNDQWREIDALDFSISSWSPLYVFVFGVKSDAGTHFVNERVGTS